jgi:hypothetical protein
MDFVCRLVFYKIRENKTFRKLDLFPSSCEGWKTPTLLGPLERANLNHWTGITGFVAFIRRLVGWFIPVSPAWSIGHP